MLPVLGRKAFSLLLGQRRLCKELAFSWPAAIDTQQHSTELASGRKRSNNRLHAPTDPFAKRGLVHRRGGGIQIDVSSAAVIVECAIIKCDLGWIGHRNLGLRGPNKIQGRKIVVPAAWARVAIYRQ